MRHRLSAVLVVALAACGATADERAATGAEGAPLPEGRVLVVLNQVADLQADPAASDPGVRQAAVADAVAGSFAQGEVFELDVERRSSDPRPRVTVTYREVSPPGGRDLLLHISVENLPDPLQPLDATVLLERELSDGAPLEDDVALAAARAARVIDAKADLSLRGRPAAERLVGDDDPELVLLALEWVREQAQGGRDAGLGDLADQVAASLAHRDERVRLMAIETLGAVGGPGHVDALLDNLRLADPGHAYRTYEALAQLGGPKATEFLGFAARNEEEPERRQAAQRAFEQAATGPMPIKDRPPVTRGHRR